MGGHGKEKPVGEGKKELAAPLAFCSSVGGRALAGTVYGTAVVQLPSRHSSVVWLKNCVE